MDELGTFVAGPVDLSPPIEIVFALILLVVAVVAALIVLVARAIRSRRRGG